MRGAISCGIFQAPQTPRGALVKRSFPRTWLCLIVATLWALPAGCDDDPATVRPPQEDSGLSSNLQSGCYSWPGEEFSPENLAALDAALPAGSAAVDFSLRDLEGNTFRLSTLLKSKPVLLVLGSYT
jgi:hypothetical protein